MSPTKGGARLRDNTATSAYALNGVDSGLGASSLNLQITGSARLQKAKSFDHDPMCDPANLNAEAKHKRDLFLEELFDVCLSVL